MSRYHIALIVVVLLGVLAVHLPYVFNGFVWLDHGDLLGGRVFKGGGIEAFVSPFGETAFYRPLVVLSLFFDRALYGMSAWGYHLTNVILHVINVVVFGWFLQRCLRVGYVGVIWGVLVVGVHPLSWLPVGAISYRADLLVVLFVFLSLICYDGFCRQKGWWTVGLAGCLGLALLSKETALFWVPALVVAWQFAGSHRKMETLKASLPMLGATGFVLSVYFWVRYMAVPAVWHRDFVPLGFEEAIGTRLAVLARQMGQVIMPTLPDLSDAMPIVGVGWSAGVGAMVLIGCAMGFVWKRGKTVGWVCAFFVIALAPVLNLVPVPRFTSPHYGYLASFGLGMGVALMMDHLSLRTVRVRWLGMSAVCIWIAVASFSTYFGGKRFLNDRTLFGPAVAVDPGFLEGHQYLGDAARRQGQVDLAQQHYASALRFDANTIAYVDWISVSTRLAEIQLKQGQIKEADRLLATAEKSASGNALQQIVYGRAIVLERLGDYNGVVERLATFDWHDPAPMLLLARALAETGQIQASVAQLKSVLHLLDAKKQKQINEMIYSLQRRHDNGLETAK